MALAQKQKKEAARGVQVFIFNVPFTQYLMAADSVTMKFPSCQSTLILVQMGPQLSWNCKTAASTTGGI